MRCLHLVICRSSSVALSRCSCMLSVNCFRGRFFMRRCSMMSNMCCLMVVRSFSRRLSRVVSILWVVVVCWSFFCSSGSFCMKVL